MDYPIRHGSLESGLGGFDYASQQMNWENIFHVEINKFCQTILKYYWPNAKSFTDIFEFDGSAWRGKVDIITAGFPCQPFSHAGKRKGSSDDRHIWPENMRIFREAKPYWIICENVPGLLTIESGVVFEQVCADLENEGYETQAFIIPACAKDAVHRRDRIWIVAHSDAIRRHNGGDNRQERYIQANERITEKDKSERNGRQCGLVSADALASHNSEQGFIADNHTGQCEQSKEQIRSRRNTFNAGDRDAADAEKLRWSGEAQQEDGREEIHTGRRRGSINSINDAADITSRGRLQNNGRREPGFNNSTNEESWLEAATRLCSMDDESTRRLDTTAISKSKWRTESLKAYGNAIYWPIAYELFKAIEEYDNQKAIKPLKTVSESAAHFQYFHS